MRYVPLDYLNGREWKGQCLIPDDRNAFGPISVGDAHIGTRTATNLNKSSPSSPRRPPTIDSGSSTPSWQTQPTSGQSLHTQHHGDPNVSHIFPSL